MSTLSHDGSIDFETLEIDVDRSGEPEELKGFPLPAKISDWGVCITSCFGMVVMPCPLKNIFPAVDSPFAFRVSEESKVGHRCVHQDFAQCPVPAVWIKVHPLSLWALEQSPGGSPSIRLIVQDFNGRYDRPFLFDLSTIGGVFELDPVVASLLVIRFEGQPS